MRKAIANYLRYVSVPRTLNGCIFSGTRVNGELCQCPCPPGWVSFGDRCFQYIGTEKTWADAELECTRLRGNLASVHNEEEEAFLLQLIKSNKATSTWLGGSDSVKEGTWLWSYGSLLDYTKWNNGGPNNYQVKETGMTSVATLYFPSSVS
ncbi:galactose-specific lectin nattectin-like [Lepisosteus oculatus]|uniref:galactose-specific lectin nattectin-like n=1 Tax=Lepisosteus oculatus TaxID=7918 RepID=UPI0037239F7A